MRVKDAFDESVNASIDNGTLDPVAHGAAIEAARKVASMMDEPSWPMVNGKLDNVSPGVFLKYCDALGLLPDAELASSVKKQPQANGLIAFRSRSKAANG